MPPRACCRRPSSWSARRWPAASARSSWSTRSTAATPAPTKSIPRCSTCSPPWTPTDEQLDFPMLYASGRQGWADATLDGPRKDLSALFDLVLAMCRRRRWTPNAPFAMVASILEYDNFLGRVLTGRIEQGRATLNMPVKVLRSDGTRGRNRPPDQAAVVPRPGPRAGRGSRGRRHHRRRRPVRRHHPRHHRRARSWPPRCPPSRSIRRRWR